MVNLGPKSVSDYGRNENKNKKISADDLTKEFSNDEERSKVLYTAPAYFDKNGKRKILKEKNKKLIESSSIDDYMPFEPSGEEGEILKYVEELGPDYMDKLLKYKELALKNRNNLNSQIVSNAYKRLKSSVGSVLKLKQVGNGKVYKGMRWGREKKVTYLRSYADVLSLQVLLKKMGYAVKLTSKFDKQTVAILKAFQTDTKLFVDGEFGPNTLRKMEKVLTKVVGVDLQASKHTVENVDIATKEDVNVDEESIGVFGTDWGDFKSDDSYSSFLTENMYFKNVHHRNMSLAEANAWKKRNESD